MWLLPRSMRVDYNGKDSCCLLCFVVYVKSLFTTISVLPNCMKPLPFIASRVGLLLFEKSDSDSRFRSVFYLYLLVKESKHCHCRSGETKAFAALAPEIATAGTPMPGKMESPAKIKLPMGVLPSEK